MNIHEHDELRGHSLLPSDADLPSIPKLYATDGSPLEEKIAWIHYFIGGCDWFLFELDQQTLTAFGWVNLNDPQNAEMGYFSLFELASVRVQWMTVERDLSWTPRLFGEVDTWSMNQ